MQIQNIRQIDKLFQKYKRAEKPIRSNGEDLFLMVIDITTEIETDQKNDILSSISIIAVDDLQRVYQVRVVNFKFFFYVEAPTYSEGELPNELQSLKKHLNSNFGQRLVSKIELLQKESFMNFKGKGKGTTNFLKIHLSDFRLKSQIRKYFEKGFTVNRYEYHSPGYESSVSYLVRFLIEKDVSGMSWIKLPAKKYKLCRSRNIVERMVELEIDEADFVGISKEDPEFMRIAPLRLLSFDIEVSSHGRLPDPQHHEVITIGIQCKNHCDDEGDFNVVF
jgi:DNA polymerase elongation subunit (family B)